MVKPNWMRDKVSTSTASLRMRARLTCESLREEEVLGRLAQQQVLVIIGEEVEAAANEIDAGLIGVLALDLEGTVAFPHAALRSIGGDDFLDHRRQVRVGRRLLAQGVEGADFYHDLLVLGQGAEALDILGANDAVGADAGQVVDDHR